MLLILMTSFVFTILEGARIKASEAQLAVLSKMAADSFSAGYCYPLFKEYGLLAVDGGFGKKEKEDGKIKTELSGYLSHFYEKSEKGLLSGASPQIGIESVGTLLESEKAGLRAQIRDEAIYEGAELLLEGIMGNKMFEAGDVLQEVYDKQAKTMETAAAVTSEILKMMALVDGVETTDCGISISETGEIGINLSFLKMFGLKDESYMKSTYGNIRIFGAAKGLILYPKDMIERVKASLSELSELDGKIAVKESEILQLKEKKRETDAKKEALIEEKEALVLNAETEVDEKRLIEIDAEIAILKDLLKDLSDMIKTEEAYRETLSDDRKEKTVFCRDGYGLIQKVLDTASSNAGEALKALAEVMIKQEIAKAAADEYEAFLKDNKEIPREILDSLLDDTVNMKAYLTLEKSGYDTKKMLKTLNEDILLLYMAGLPEFNGSAPDKMIKHLENSAAFIGEMTYDGLKFNYGGLKGSRETGENVKGTLARSLSGGLLKYLGVTELSEKKLNGLDLPSKGEWGTESEDIFSAFEKMGDFFNDTDPGEMLKRACETLSADFLTEVWLAGHFSNYTSQRTDTMLCYEREYVLAGKKSDAENLASAVLKLTAFRAVFTFASLMADGTRSGEAFALAASVSGFTGIPALLYVIKYAILVTWALEEALVEVSGLLMGKKVPIYSASGRISIGEILVMTGERVRAKASAIPDNMPGIGYMQYITVLSFFEGLEKKELRIADLIQENIRLKYRDTFRMKNAVTDVSFTSSVTVGTKFDTGFFSPDVYTVTSRTDMSY